MATAQKLQVLARLRRRLRACDWLKASLGRRWNRSALKGGGFFFPTCNYRVQREVALDASNAEFWFHHHGLDVHTAVGSCKNVVMECKKGGKKRKKRKKHVCIYIYIYIYIYSSHQLELNDNELSKNNRV